MRKLSIAALLAALYCAPVLAAEEGYIPWTWDDETEETGNQSGADAEQGR